MSSSIPSDAAEDCPPTEKREPQLKRKKTARPRQGRYRRPSGCIVQRGPNTFAVKFEIGRDPITGKRRSRWITVHGSWKDADKELAKINAMLAEDKYRESSGLTLNEFIQQWLEAAEPRLGATTFGAYKRWIDTNIAPAIGNVRLKDLRASRIDKFYKDLLDCGRKDVSSIKAELRFEPEFRRIVGAKGSFKDFRRGDPIFIEGTMRNDGKYTVRDFDEKRSLAIVDRPPKPEGPVTATIKPPGLSKTTVLNIHQLLVQVLGLAVKRQLIQSNPMDGVIHPRKEKRRLRTLTAEECLELLDALEGYRYHLVVAIGVYTGMRIGEILGLQWSNIDMDNRTISVVQSAVRAKGGLLVLKRPKTPDGDRLIPFDAELLPILRRRKIEQDEERRQLGSAYQNNDLVACQLDGRVLNGASVSSKFRKYARKLGYPVRFHDLRHSYATLMMELGNPKIVSQLLGHSNPGFTLKTYTHPGAEAAKRVVRRHGEVFRKARRKTMSGRPKKEEQTG